MISQRLLISIGGDPWMLDCIFVVYRFQVGTDGSGMSFTSRPTPIETHIGLAETSSSPPKPTELPSVTTTLSSSAGEAVSPGSS